MRVDGLACPYCAYGVEKKLKAIEGVEKVHVDLNKGLVTVDVKAGTELTEAQMKQLFQDAGFTFRSMTRKEIPSPGWPCSPPPVPWSAAPCPSPW